MLEDARLEAHHRVLEPSVGKGDIADAIRRAVPEASLTVVEMNRTLADVLTAKGYDPVFGDFLQFGRGEIFDRVLMNPPFEHGRDMDHVQHAYSQLARGGRLVAVMSEGPFFRSDQRAENFRRWLEELGGKSESLPDDAFSGKDAFRHTSVRTRLVVIDKR
jgi:16S rRNA G1207 methylase RsmC